MLKGRKRGQGQAHVWGRKVWAGRESPASKWVRTRGKEPELGVSKHFLKGLQCDSLRLCGQEADVVYTVTPLATAAERGHRRSETEPTRAAQTKQVAAWAQPTGSTRNP